MLRLAPRVFFGACILTSTLAAGCGGDVQESTGSGTTTTTTDTGGGGSGGETSTGGVGGMVVTGGMGGSGGSTNGMPSDVCPAPHAAPPKVVSYGGPRLESPKIVPIFFANDDANFDSKIEDFNNKVGATNYWTAIAAEYGVGPATGLPAIYSADTPTGTIDDTDIQAWLASKLNADDPAFPAPDGNTLYALFYPQGLSITLDSGGGPPAQSCTQFGGYHSDLSLDANHGNMLIPYAVMPHCTYPGETPLETMTATASHEYIEAATDPYPMSDPAYAVVDTAHIYWLFALGGGEVGDLCAQSQSSFVTFPELNYMVQRSWSNASAKAGHDPCVPTLPGEVYFNAAPVLSDNVTLNIGQNITVKGVKIPLGESKTIAVDLFSDAKTSGPWTVKAVDSSVIQGGPKQLDFAFDKDTGVNGEKLNLTITVLKTTPYKAEIFYLMSTLNGTRNMWVGIVGN